MYSGTSLCLTLRAPAAVVIPNPTSRSALSENLKGLSHGAQLKEEWCSFENEQQRISPFKTRPSGMTQQLLRCVLID